MKTRGKYRFADSTAIEPLVHHWSAWTYLLSPAPASFHLLSYQKKLLESFLAGPKLHAAASRDPELVGGAFVGLPADRAGEARLLLEEVVKDRRDELELAGAITQFYNWLVEQANGLSLAPYYQSLPIELRGYVELVYDYYHRPTVRFFEGLLYRSRYYKKELQALRLFNLRRDDSRQFLINTPRLAEAGQFHWNIPFDDERVDELFRLDSRPQEWGSILELLGVTATEAEGLSPLWTSDWKPLPEKWRGPSIRIRCLGHACVLVEWNGVAILTDPCVSVKPSEGGLERVSYQDLPQTIDYVLVTHLHHDHFNLETLLRLRHRIGEVVVPKSAGLLYGDVSLKLMCQTLGFKRVLELDPLESIQLPEGEIIAIPFLGEHGDLAHSKSAYVIRAGKERMMFGADSDCLDRQVYEHIRKSIGPIETVFLGTESVGAPLSWIYGPLFPAPPKREQDESRRQHGSDARAALEILETVGAKRIYNYAMGLEPWMEHILGLGLTEQSPQWKASVELLSKARHRGYQVVERPYGVFETHLGDLILTSSSKRPRPAEPIHEFRAERNGRRAKISARASLSISQEFYLWLDEAWGGRQPNNLAIFARLIGPLRVGVLDRAIIEVQRRHTSLRSCLKLVDGEPAYLTSIDALGALRVIDIPSSPDPAAEAERIAAEETGQRIDLSVGSQLRGIVLRFESEEHFLILVAPRWSVDDRSMELLLGELATLYSAFAEGEPSPLSKPALQYGEFSAWQRWWLTSESGQEQLSYWENQLAGVLPAPNLSTALPAPANEIEGFRIQTFQFSEQLSEALRAFADQTDCSLFVVLLTSLQVLLHRYTGAEDLLIGAQFNNRRAGETESLIGPVANTVPLRTDLSGDPDFITLLRRNREVFARALECQGAPFGSLAKWLGAGTPAAASWPLGIMLTLDEPQDLPIFQGLTTERVQFLKFQPEFGLAFHLNNRGQLITGSVCYQEGFFSFEAIAMMIGHFEMLIRGILLQPDQFIGSLQFLNEDCGGQDDVQLLNQEVNDFEAQFAF